MRNESRFRWWWACAAALIALLALGFVPGAFAEADGAGDTWTVLIYMCGSDMETKAGMATCNLHEIMQAPHPSHTVRYDAAAGGWADVDLRSRVNVLVETGARGNGRTPRMTASTGGWRWLPTGYSAMSCRMRPWRTESTRSRWSMNSPRPAWPTRTVQPLTQLQGREYRLLYPVYTGEECKENRRRYESGDPMTIYRTLDVEEMELPEGVYYCNYMLETSLRKVYWTELVKLYWDGSAFTVVE